MVDIIEKTEQILRISENLGMEDIFCFGNKLKKKTVTLGSEDGLRYSPNFKVFPMLLLYMTLSFRNMETLTFVVLDYSVIYSGK